MTFTDEAKFEDAVVDTLQRKGWGEVLNHPSEADLLANWAQILFQNNRGIDRLGDVPLTESEMHQIMEQIADLRTPLRLNEFINGKSVSIKRDAPGAHNVGKEVSLKIYDRHEIAGGQSHYQIARQPRYSTPNQILPSRRGDLMLLINGMPVIHIELKKEGVPVGQACNQIDKYAHEGVFGGIFSLVQVFVAMTPSESLYFANPGPDGVFNPDFFFHWGDFNNEPVNEWASVVEMLLSIPMAHQMIGWYTVTDRAAGHLMVMRSYQYFAARKISDAVKTHTWGQGQQRGGHIWHTTGSGKTVTSFKTAQLIADSHDADKVVFLLDRIELGTQSLINYRSFGGDSIDVGETADTTALLAQLKDDDSDLIVTSIQKMSRISEDEGVKAADLAKIREKRVVFIVDEAHRSTFGDMLLVIKQTLPDALFFGFTGTPIHEENQKKASTTTTIFGDELHRYSIADGIRDKNVLGFDPQMIETFDSTRMRKEVGLREAHADSETELLTDPVKMKVFQRFQNPKLMPMAANGPTGGKGIESYIPTSQYDSSTQRDAVVADIVENWITTSKGGKFHALFATSSIAEAIEYYRIFKRDEYKHLAVTTLFDPNIDNSGESQKFKEDGLVEVLTDYNARFGRNYTLPTYADYKKDVANRLAHKKPHNTPAFTRDKQINILIVVDQMLTGFDSKWVNTLYLDKVMEYESIIQAFSRTNRIFGPDKPFGSIKYYRYPHTMRVNIEKAVALYSGDKPMGLFVDHLDEHLKQINSCFDQIKTVFAGIDNFAALPESQAEQGEFAKLFGQMYHALQAAQVQGFTWNQSTYTFTDPERTITVDLDEQAFVALITRYQELARDSDDDDGDTTTAVPFDLDAHISHIDTATIDADYMDSKFTKYLRALRDNLPASELEALLEELHSSFARLSVEDQGFADLWLRDISYGEARLVEGKTVNDYINDYKQSHKDRQIAALVSALGVDETALRELLNAHVNDATIDEYGRFTKVLDTIDKEVAKAFFEGREGRRLPLIKLNIEIQKLLKRFVLADELPEDLDPELEGTHSLEEASC